MRGLLTGRTVLLAGPLYDFGDLIALPLAAAGATVVLAGPDDHNSRQLWLDIQRAGGTASSVVVKGSDFDTPASTVDLVIRFWPSPGAEAAGSTADGNTAALAGLTVVEGRPEAIVEVCSSPDGETRVVRFTIQHQQTLPPAGDDPAVTRVCGDPDGASASVAVAGQLLRWAFNALMPSGATPISTPTRPAEDILWEDEGRADEDLNFELA